MTNQEIQSYKRMGIPVKQPKKKRYQLQFSDFVEAIFCFLLSKVFLFGMISPFGISYYAAIFPKNKRALSFAAVCLGFLSAGMRLYIIKYIAALVISAATSFLMEQEFRTRPFLYGLVAALSLFVTGLVMNLVEGFLLYDFLFQILESVLSFLSFFAFRKAFDVVRSLPNRKTFEPAETLSLLVLCGGTVISLSSVSALEGVAHTISVALILITALTCGFPLSCAAGVLFGLANSLTVVLPAQVVATYAVSALCAGLLQKRGRIGVILGFLVTNAAVMLYYNGAVDTVIASYHVIAAGILLFALPDGWLAVFGELVQSPTYAEDSASRLRDIMADRLMTAASSFSALSDVFNEAVDGRINAQMRDPGPLFDKTAEQVCRDCSLQHYCWQKDYNETRRNLLSLYEKMEWRSRAELSDVPLPFKEDCIRLDLFLEVLNRQYEIHRVNALWAGRVLESRHLVAEQFRNISSVLSHLKQELLLEPSEGIYLERKLMAALDRNGISTQSLRVTGSDAVEVSLTVNAEEGQKDLIGQVGIVLSAALKVPMLRMSARQTEEGLRLRFIEQTRYTMEAGLAQMASSGKDVCGDHHLLSVSADGKYVLALSDGMGQGSEAEAQSNMTVDLLRRLLTAGFDKETALKLMNSILMVNTDRESFSTADLCLVNLYSGALEFIKIGASQSYVKSGDAVETVHCSSLPAGIVCSVEADCDLKYAKEGDFVVLVTDGISDALSRDGKNSLSELIRQFNGENAQKLADDILEAALSSSGGVAKDDMTVIAARLVAA